MIFKINNYYRFKLYYYIDYTTIIIIFTIATKITIIIYI